MPNMLATIFGLYNNPISLLTEDHHNNKIVVDKMFGLRAVSLNDPDCIRQVFITNRHKYGIDPIRKLLLKRGFGQGLASIEGEQWRSVRRMSVTQFSNRKLQTYAAQMAQITSRFCKRQPDQQSVLLARLVTGLAMDNGLKCLFSKDRDHSFGPTMDTNSNYLEFGMAIDPLDILRWPVDLPRLLKKPIGRIQRRHRAIVEALYHRRIDRIGSKASAPDDLLTSICRHFESDTGAVKKCPAALDNIGTMLGASYDTTSKVISWALYMLVNAPEALSAVRAEIDAGVHDNLPPHEWPGALPISLASVRETLRLYPVIPGMVRHAREADRIGGQVIRKGDYVIASLWLLHRSNRHWNNASRFKIMRFLPGGEADSKPDCYLPFGIGPRMCIGHQFAELESVITLAYLLRHFDFRYTGSKPPMPVWKGTLRSSNGIPVIMNRRQMDGGQEC